MTKTVSTTALLATLVLAFGCGRNEPPPAHPSESAQDRPATSTTPVAPAVGASQTPTEAANAGPASAANGTATSSAGSVASAQSATEAATPAGASDAAPKKRAPVRTPDVIYVPTPQPVVDKMLELAKPKKTDVLYDLGCGDGRIVVTAAKKYGVKAFGYDIDPERVDEAKENVRKNGVEHLLTIEEKDIFTLDLSPANIVTLYLLPELNVKLIPQLEKLKPGSRVVTHDFEIEGIKPVTTFDFPAGSATQNSHEVYLFNIPFKKVQKK
jgi:hypothetical protein